MIVGGNARLQRFFRTIATNGSDGIRGNTQHWSPSTQKKNKSLSRMHERRHITSTRWAGTVGNVAPRPDTSRIPADEGGRLFRQARRRFLFIYFFFAVYNNDPGRAHSRLNNSSLYTQPRLPITHINCIWRHLYVPVPRLYTDFDMRITHARKSE